MVQASDGTANPCWCRSSAGQQRVRSPFVDAEQDVHAGNVLRAISSLRALRLLRVLRLCNGLQVLLSPGFSWHRALALVLSPFFCAGRIGYLVNSCMLCELVPSRKACQSFASSLCWSMVLLLIFIIVGALVIGNILQDFIQDQSANLDDRQWIWHHYGTAYRSWLTLYEVTFACWFNLACRAYVCWYCRLFCNDNLQ